MDHYPKFGRLSITEDGLPCTSCTVQDDNIFVREAELRHKISDKLVLRRQNLIWKTEDTILAINDFVIGNTTIFIEETALVKMGLVVHWCVVLCEHLGVRVKIFTNQATTRNLFHTVNNLFTLFTQVCRIKNILFSTEELHYLTINFTTCNIIRNFIFQILDSIGRWSNLKVCKIAIEPDDIFVRKTHVTGQIRQVVLQEHIHKDKLSLDTSVFKNGRTVGLSIFDTT